MPTSTQLDDLWVVDIRRVEADRNHLGWTCRRCGEEHAPTKSWWATFTAADVDAFTVAICDHCWAATRRRLEHEVFGYAGPVR